MFFAVVAVSTLHAESVSITGTVTDHNGDVVEGVTIRLLKGNLSSVTGSSGIYTLTGQTGVRADGTPEIFAHRLTLRYRNNAVTIYSPQVTNGTVSLFNINGQLAATVYKGTFRRGENRLFCALPNHGVYLLRVSCENGYLAGKIINVKMDRSSFIPASNNTVPVHRETRAKSSTVITDSIRAEKEGYTSDTRALDSYVGITNFRLVPEQLKWPVAGSDYIFDDTVVRTYDLLLAPDSLKYLDDNPWAEDYVEGKLVFEGDTIHPVGIRYKGSWGSFASCTDGEPGRKTCTKLSFKVKFDWKKATRERRFYGQNRLQFHCMNRDTSQLKERIGYRIFNAMGSPAPRTAHVRLMVNGKLSGLYLLVEVVDSRFAEYHFKDGSGNVYKEVWPLKIAGEPYEASILEASLRSDEKSTSSVDMMLAFGNALASAQGDTIKTVLSEWMDIRSTVANFAVCRSIGHQDSPFKWRARHAPPSWYEDADPKPKHTNHNYFFCEEPAERKLYLIGWDLDLILTDVKDTSVIPVPGDPPPESCDLSQSSLNALCDKFTAGILTFEAEYREAARRYVDEIHPLLEPTVSKWADQIREVIIEAHAAHEDALTESEWDAGVTALKKQLQLSRAIMAEFAE